MLRIFVCLLGLLLGASRSGALNPSFDKETLALQVAMTDWKSKDSIHELISVMQDQIPMTVSPKCNSAVRNFVFDLMQKEMYAVRMVDAFGKTPSGLMLGHLLIFGHFDQCLGVRRFNATTGQDEQAANYCLVRLHEPSIAARLPALPAYGACLPLECANPSDAEGFVTGLFKPLRAAANLNAVQGICVTPLAKTPGFYVMISICVLILIVVIAAGVVHCAFRRRYDTGKGLNGTEIPLQQPSVEIYTQKTATNGTTVVQHTEITKKPKFGYANIPTFLRPLLCFHIPTNLSSIGAMAGEGEIAFLHGFRVLSMWWIILGHTYYLGMNFVANRLMLYFKARTLTFQLILNAGYAVDSFFLLSGLLITYVLVRELTKNNGKLNWIVVYFHRWWRLTPVYVFVMMFYVYVMPHGIESPWKLLIAQQGAPTEYCKSYWWSNILYINNFFPVYRKGQCMNWTWFLALDMQFFIITPIIVFIMYKSYRAGAAIVGVIVVACVATTMAIIGSYNLPIHMFQEPVTYNVTIQNAQINGSWVSGHLDGAFYEGPAPWYIESQYPAVYNNQTHNNDTILAVRNYEKDVDYIYEKPYTRITPFVIGILLGFMFARRPTYKFSKGGKLIAGAGWLVSTVVALLLLFGFHLADRFNMMPPIQTMSLSARIIYGGLQRLGWSAVCAWILFACNYGYGGYVTKILSLRFWRPFSNLTYGAYLVHMLTLQLYFASQRSMIFFSTINFITVFLSQIFLAYGAALFFAVLIEVPLLRLERLILKKTL
ncbi:nose resistant to fluoxetine protein 6-like [Paramacrobiotus metropolitanus]|uniref:nose resistant to fluoxetine protein 6-like n=1 Tax=Paramacrobiotus metropolitanus TaxID=2943436 RepID=UPI002445F03D|nr:nose resistant to fluoxetine protein 6-like [Paramacrobiotus metropolitanus]XP_055338679.1 nose resistant to fluoxetine protein 6-like [Paramacrobiotus metropolitanus]